MDNKPTPFSTCVFHGDLPGVRRRHTLEMVDDTKAILFGGYFINKGAYVYPEEVHELNLATNSWTRIHTTGTSPGPRYAHSASCVDPTKMLVYGGSNAGDELVTGDLFSLDLSRDPYWEIVPVTGTSPGPR